MILDQNIRYHCPVFGIPKFTKRGDRGDYNHMGALASTTNWHSLQDDDVDIYALNLTNKILHIAKECIPNRVVTIRPDLQIPHGSLQQLNNTLERGKEYSAKPNKQTHHTFGQNFAKLEIKSHHWYETQNHPFIKALQINSSLDLSLLGTGGLH